MDSLVSILKKIFAYPKRILLTLSAAIIFLVLLFPFSDLSDYVSTMVSTATKNAVYLQFENLSLAALPGPGLKLTDVVVESTMAPELELSSLSVAPSITGLPSLLSGKPLVSVAAEGLYGGNLSLSTSNSKTIKGNSGLRVQALYDQFDLKVITRSLKQKNKIPFVSTGTGRVETDLNISTTMEVQPEGFLKTYLSRPNIPPFTVNLGSFGSLPMPGLQLDAVNFDADLKAGRMIIKNTTIGTNKNNLHGTISGSVDIKLGRGFSLQRLGLYNLEIDLTVKKALKNELGAMLAFISKYESKTFDGARYRFRMKGQVGGPPKFSAL